MEFFIPKSGTITVAGHPQRLIRGVHDVSDAIADSREAIAYGIKPVEEMTDAEWVSTGRKKPEPVKAKALDGAVKPSTPAAALDGAVRSVKT